MPEAILLFVAAVLGGALNSVAGGGSFITFPALISAGVPSINASATNTLALWPGSVASVGAYRNEVTKWDTRLMILLIVMSILGGFVGAEVLLQTPKETFDKLIPFLLLAAVLLFTYGGSIAKLIRERVSKGNFKGGILLVVAVAVLQFFISVYGGYFGAGIGILMLASLALTGMTNIHTMNGLKTVLASFINGMAMLRFILAGSIYYPQAIVMLFGAILGGYGGAAYAQRLDPKLVRRFVIVVGFVMTAIFFYTTYLSG
ncbi:MAG: sulfite exporter TauE/SafE family protein [Anaerolineae bacterium]